MKTFTVEVTQVVTDHLANCPFCGSDHVGFKHQGLPDCKAGCNGCNMQTPWMPNRSEAVAYWNRRSDLTAASQLEHSGLISREKYNHIVENIRARSAIRECME